MSITALTGFTDAELTAIDAAYSAPIRYISHRLVLGRWEYVESTRRFNASISITTGINSIKIKSDAGNFPVGQTVCTSAELQLVNGILYGDAVKSYVIKVETGISPDGINYTYYTLGYFTPDSVTSEDDFKTVSIVAYDAMYKLNNKKFAKKSGTLTAYDYFNPLWGAFGATTRSVLNSISISATEAAELNGLSAREALGYIAAKNASCFKINRNGELQAFTLTNYDHIYNADNRDKMQFKADEEAVAIKNIIAGTSTNYVETSVNSAGATMAISTPLLDSASSAALTAIKNTLTAMGQYATGSLSTRGNPAWCIGAIINFKDAFNKDKKIVIASVDYDVTGGSMSVKSVIPEDELMYGEEKATKSYVKEAIQEAIEGGNAGGGESGGEISDAPCITNLYEPLGINLSDAEINLATACLAEGTTTDITTSNYSIPETFVKHSEFLRTLWNGNYGIYPNNKVTVFEKNGNELEFKIAVRGLYNENHSKTFCLDVLFYKYAANDYGTVKEISYGTVKGETDRYNYGSFYTSISDGDSATTYDLYRNDAWRGIGKQLLLCRYKIYFKPQSDTVSYVHFKVPCDEDEGVVVLDYIATELYNAPKYTRPVSVNPLTFGVAYDREAESLRVKAITITGPQANYGLGYRDTITLLNDRIVLKRSSGFVGDDREEIELTVDKIKQLLALLH